jgi:hypothetical protein
VIAKRANRYNVGIATSAMICHVVIGANDG